MEQKEKMMAENRTAKEEYLNAKKQISLAMKDVGKIKLGNCPDCEKDSLSIDYFSGKVQCKSIECDYWTHDFLFFNETSQTDEKRSRINKITDKLVLHEGEDYITLKVGDMEVEVQDLDKKDIKQIVWFVKQEIVERLTKSDVFNSSVGFALDNLDNEEGDF